jgi:hypothetical protein
MIPDAVFTDKHYPWQKVTKERLQKAYDDLTALGLEPSIATEPKNDRIRWWCGAGLLGYEQVSDGEFYLHPMHMDVVEKVEFEPMIGFDHLKTDDSISTMLLNI